MKVYDVEYRAVITLAAQDMQKAALHGVEFIKDNPRLLYVRAVHERNFQVTDAITLYPGTITQVVNEHLDPARNAELLQTEDAEEQSLHVCRQVIEGISKVGGID